MWNEEYRDGIKTRGDKMHYSETRSSLQTTMPTGNTSPILPPSSIIVVWLCGQLNACTNMYIHTFLCVHVACVCSTILIMLLLLDVTTGGKIRLVLPVGIVVCRELLSHIAKIHPSLSCLLLFLCHPYIPHSTIRRIFFIY